MTRSHDPQQAPTDPEDASFAARLTRKYGAGVDPEVSLDRAGPEGQSSAPRGASSELLQRLADHSLKQSRYKLQGEIARGGMGAILKVWDEDLRRTLAMKVILGKVDSPVDSPPDSPMGGGTPPVDTRTLGRFLEEAQVTGQLDHPGIAPVHELGLDSDGRVYFTMKLVQGRDLKAIFDLVFEEKEGWNETRALSVMLKVCEAMAYAHSKGVIHRDLKPANVMVGSFGEVYVMDWGLARVLGRKDTHDIRLRPDFASSLTAVKTERREEREDSPDSPLVTMDGDVLGTPAYMPPEQARGQIDKLTPRSDVYAIGAMLYHLLARQTPYVPLGKRLGNGAVLLLVHEGPPTRLHELRTDVPAELVAICEKAMSRDAAQRYPDTLALADDLRAYLEHRVVAAYETGAVAELKKWVGRNKALAAASAAAVLLLIGGLVVSSTLYAKADESAKRAAAGEEQAKLERDRADAKSREAEDNARAAQAEKQRATASEERAVLQERGSTQRANDVLSLSAIQDLKVLEDRADALWPADPELVPKYEAWLTEARGLIEGRAADPSRGIKSKPSLLQHEAKLAEIRQRAKPLTEEEVEADRRASPSCAEWEKARAKLTWMRRMLGEEPWPSEAEVEAVLAEEALPSDANALNSLASPLVVVDPAKVGYGSEVRTLLLARRAVATAQEGERAGVRDTLGWALFRCGRMDEALAEEQRAVDEAQGQQKEELSASLRQRQEQVAQWKGAEARAKRSEEATQLALHVAELEGAVNERRTYEFEEGEDGWWHAQLSKLVSDLKVFTDEQMGGLFSSGVSEKNGWGIVRRAEFAGTIGERSVDGPGASRLWSEAIAAIASSPKYGGLKLAPQLGLIPIGADPASGLWEFAHMQTGEPAVRDADGKLTVTEEMGLVFVLIPSGTFWMGAQKTDENVRNYDPQAVAHESPVHEVTLSAYLLSKYEMTQGQWLRIVARNPSYYGPSSKLNGHQHDLTHPVEQVTWTDCMQLMERLGLLLPSEAQWENGCRAGTDTPWWTGSEREGLRGKINLADQTAKSGGASWADINDWPDLEDGWVVHAPVGTLAANQYGLQEVHGNVWEWCRDGYDIYSAEKQLDPVTPWRGASNRVLRGSSFDYASTRARSANRDSNKPETQFGNLGLRPAKGISIP